MWKFINGVIPAPFVEGIWTIGDIAENVIAWFKENGWHLRYVVNMKTGETTIYELPESEPEPEEPKANEESVEDYASYKEYVENVIRVAADIGMLHIATKVYMGVHKCDISTAINAVMEICGK